MCFHQGAGPENLRFLAANQSEKQAETRLMANMLMMIITKIVCMPMYSRLVETRTHQHTANKTPAYNGYCKKKNTTDLLLRN